MARIQDLFKIGTDHSFRLSTEYRCNEMDSTPDNGGRVAYDVYSVGGMWDWAISDKLSFVNALRLDHLRLKRSGGFTGAAPFTNADYDRTLTEPSLNSGLVYKATDVDTFRAAVARGVQVPSLIEYGYMAASARTGSAVPFYGSPTIDPSLVTNYELGYDRAISAIDGSFKASVYYQTNDDVKAGGRFTRVGSATVGYFANTGDSTIFGVEGSLKGKIDAHWGWKVGYAFERVRDNFTSTLVEFEESTPRHKASAEITYTSGPWEANLFALSVSEVKMLRADSAALVSVPDYLSLSGRVAYSITKDVQVALTGMDVGHKNQRLTSGQAEERRVFLSLTSKF